METSLSITCDKTIIQNAIQSVHDRIIIVAYLNSIINQCSLIRIQSNFKWIVQVDLLQYRYQVH